MHGMVAWNEALALQIIGEKQGLEGAMLPILHALQEEFGYIDHACIPQIASALNLSKAEVYGTITFYHDFRHAPAGQRVIKLCRAEACQSVGCESLVDHMAQSHGIAIDATTPDGRLTFETVYCLGNCALGPAALVNGALVGRLDADQLSRLCRGDDVQDHQMPGEQL